MAVLGGGGAPFDERGTPVAGSGRLRVPGRGTMRAESAQRTPTQSHISPSILVYEDNLLIWRVERASCSVCVTLFRRACRFARAVGDLHYVGSEDRGGRWGIPTMARHMRMHHRKKTDNESLKETQTLALGASAAGREGYNLKGVVDFCQMAQSKAILWP